MKFGNTNKNKQQDVDIDNSENRSPNDIEVVIGDDSDLEISNVGDYIGSFKPKTHDNKKKNVVIPKANIKKKKNK